MLIKKRGEKLCHQSGYQTVISESALAAAPATQLPPLPARKESSRAAKVPVRVEAIPVALIQAVVAPESAPEPALAAALGLVSLLDQLRILWFPRYLLSYLL